MLVSLDGKLFEETRGVDDRPRSGRPRTVHTPKAIKLSRHEFEEILLENKI